MASEERQRRREGSRRAQAARTRRAEARQRRKQKNLFLALGGGIGAAAIIALLIVVLSDSGPTLGYDVQQLGGQHAPPYLYVQEITVDGEVVRIPPTSGNHFPSQSSYGFLGDQIIPEAAVHNMEHGAVVIWYQPDDTELAAEINRLVRSTGPQCIVAGEYSDMSVPIAATVWGRVLPQATYDESEMRAFINENRGERGPEAGLCRNQS